LSQIPLAQLFCGSLYSRIISFFVVIIGFGFWPLAKAASEKLIVKTKLPLLLRSNVYKKQKTKTKTKSKTN